MSRSCSNRISTSLRDLAGWVSSSEGRTCSNKNSTELEEVPKPTPGSAGCNYRRGGVALGT